MKFERMTMTQAEAMHDNNDTCIVETHPTLKYTNGDRRKWCVLVDVGQGIVVGHN